MIFKYNNFKFFNQVNDSVNLSTKGHHADDSMETYSSLVITLREIWLQFKHISRSFYQGLHM